MPASMRLLWLLRASGPVYIQSHPDADGAQVQRPIRCECDAPIEGEWLIAADDERVVFVCRCGRRQSVGALALGDIAAMVDAEPLRPHWTDIDHALVDLGWT